MDGVSGTRVFLVEDSSDDEFFIRRAMERLFEDLDIRVAVNGEEAMAALLDENAKVPSLILIDVKLPRVGGLEVLQALRKDPRYLKTPVVILTSSTERMDIETAYSLGANGYVSKPVKFDEYVEKFGSVLHYWLKINTT
jgi:two-component system response regulator